jgi:Ca2+-binding RTX toxin-like protein
VLFDTSMRVRFLVSGLAFFAVAIVAATVPVLAQGGTTAACTIKGTSGGDHLHGGPGNDKLYARDAIKDYIDGGTGFDYARDDDPEDVLHSIESH